jgi:hypothetical protein
MDHIHCTIQQFLFCQRILAQVKDLLYFNNVRLATLRASYLSFGHNTRIPFLATKM